MLCMNINSIYVYTVYIDLCNVYHWWPKQIHTSSLFTFLGASLRKNHDWGGSRGELGNTGDVLAVWSVHC